MIYRYKDIRRVHLEISSQCNAECPMCPRNLKGYPYNEGYEEHSMTLAEAKRIFLPEFIGQLSSVEINGNFGDMVMNPHSVDIIRYFKQHATALDIEVSTNGAARNADFWQALATTGAHVYFCLDGLEDTHSLYRRNTRYSTVLKNAQTFIQAGGWAGWKMIAFDHNLHQFDQARQLSKSLGFQHFRPVNGNRTNSAVYRSDGKLDYVIGKSDATVDNTIYPLLDQHDSGVLPLQYVTTTVKNKITCEVKTSNSIYINSIGEVYPCCYLGFNPRTYGRGSYMGAANSQLRELMQPNNALDVGIEQAMAWFDAVEQSWTKTSVESGRLIHCNDNCGCD